MPGEEWALAHLFIGSEIGMKMHGLQEQHEELRCCLNKGGSLTSEQVLLGISCAHCPPTLGGPAPVINKDARVLAEKPARTCFTQKWRIHIRAPGQEPGAAGSPAWRLWEPQESPWLPLCLHLSGCFVLPASFCFSCPKG